MRYHYISEQCQASLFECDAQTLIEVWQKATHNNECNQTDIGPSWFLDKQGKGHTGVYEFPIYRYVVYKHKSLEGILELLWYEEYPKNALKNALKISKE